MAGDRFGEAAAAYEQGRPEYPAEAAAWLVPAAARTVADVGAGTGKFTAALVAEGRTVHAVDPDERMLERLRERLPEVRTHVGTGERIPLPDAAVDAVTFAQAWHWVDPPAAAAEVARVLRPGGTLGLIWNIRDERVPWVAEMTRIMTASTAEEFVAAYVPEVGPPFTPLERHELEWSRELSVEDLLAMAASRSYVIAATPAQQERIAREIRELCAGQETVTLPYVTHSFRAVTVP